MQTYQDKIKQFSDFIQEKFTDNEIGIFYDESASIMLENVMEVIKKNPNAITVLRNTEIMVMVGKLIGRDDFMKPNGDFNPMVIFDFSKDEYKFDLLGIMPDWMRNWLLSKMGV